MFHAVSYALIEDGGKNHENLHAAIKYRRVVMKGYQCFIVHSQLIEVSEITSCAVL